MEYKNETLKLTREQFYSANADFASARHVTDGHEVVDYQSGNPYRIWHNDINNGFTPH